MNLLLPAAFALLGAAPLPAAAPQPAQQIAQEAAQQATKSGKWERIFDGRTLKGWTPKITGRAVGEDPLHMFVVKDGAIRVSHAGYKEFRGEFGHLFWKAPLTSYRLRFDYRMFGPSLPGIERWQTSNSGLMLHAQPPATMGRDQQFPVSLEFQLLGVPRPDREPSGNLCTPGTTVVFEGKRDPRHCILSTSPLLPVGQWARAEVEVRDDGTITHSINGTPVLRYTAAELDPADKDAQPLIAAAGGRLTLRQGYVALQSEGQQIEFKNIEVQRLD